MTMNNTASDKYDLSNANFKDLITEFFEFYTTPAFGARSKSEIDLKVFELLGKCGYIDDTDSGEESDFERQTSRRKPA